MTLVGERKACAAAVMAFFATIFFLNAMVLPPQFLPMMLGLMACYLAAFTGIVAGYFWARWFSLGLSFSGLIIAGLIWIQVGWDPIVGIYGGSHGLAALALSGRALQAAYDGRREWRERWRMDENAANRLGKAILRAGASLPYLIMAGLAPRQGGLGWGMALLVGALVVAAFGLRGVVRMRTWGVFALGMAAGLVALGASESSWLQMASPVPSMVVPLGGALLLLAIAPFVAPLARALRKD